MNLHIRPEEDDSATAVADDGRARTTGEQLLAALADGRNKRARKLLQRMHPAKVAALLERLRIDPALAGSVILTTVNDVVGFFAFPGLATVLL